MYSVGLRSLHSVLVHWDLCNTEGVKGDLALGALFIIVGVISGREGGSYNVRVKEH